MRASESSKKERVVRILRRAENKRFEAHLDGAFSRSACQQCNHHWGALEAYDKVLEAFRPKRSRRP